MFRLGSHWDRRCRGMTAGSCCLRKSLHGSQKQGDVVGGEERRGWRSKGVAWRSAGGLFESLAGRSRGSVVRSAEEAREEGEIWAGRERTGPTI